MPRGAPAAFSGDKFEESVDPAHNERLNDAVLADGGDEFGQMIRRERGARLQRTGHDLRERNRLHPLARRFRRGDRFSGCFGRSDECAESATECWFRHDRGS